ncbi:hypothetical protein WOLCODRAFT_149434 [Wolfiporia cocos MD-104 SS10]|uniref:Uncharacterized protein n=1 Tax=Wolfiporia cocos (strain MD-104) TaxID=742152 RepID=A0A2H3JR64_WOLCO|nr:hypothetical protein WOLCODRAFT_149434 [Wolfiporia cocos MD-104 SS10]
MTSRIESTLWSIDPTTPHDPPDYSRPTNGAELQARLILWRAIEYYFACLPRLRSPEEQELENRCNIFLVWEATGDANHLHARRALGLPQPTTSRDIAQRLFCDLLQSRSLPARSMRELHRGTNGTPPPYPDGSHRTSSEHITTSDTGRTNISVISLPSGYQRGPPLNNPVDNADPQATGSSTVPTIFAGVVDSINQVIDRMSARSTLFGEPRQPPHSAETGTFTMNRTPRPSNETGRNLSGTTNA